MNIELLKELADSFLPTLQNIHKEPIEGGDEPSTEKIVRFDTPEQPKIEEPKPLKQILKKPINIDKYFNLFNLSISKSTIYLFITFIVCIICYFVYDYINTKKEEEKKN